MITKTAFGTAVFLAMAGAAQAQGMNTDCTEDNMMKMQSQVDSMTSESQKAQKEMAMADMEKAKAAMQAKDMNDCKAHMEKIMKSTAKG